ncbi:hypothetical protein ABT340_06855 [Streptosporangium sp. NPDC000239]|uniref:hypothetical protein n=1 Tax=Streptosporangium sp. NPDC000239 TaxID=3154248 RepID=UPI0033309BF5
MAEEFHDIKHLMSMTNPVPRHHLVGAAHDDQGRAALRRALEQTAEASLHGAPRMWTRRRLLAAGAVAMAATATVVIRQSSSPTPLATPPMLHYRLMRAPTSIPPSAQAVLLALATVVDRQSSTHPPADAAFSLITTNIWDLNVTVADQKTTSVIVPKLVQQWTPLAMTGSGRRVERRGKPQSVEEAKENSAEAVDDAAALSDEAWPAGADMGPWSDALARSSDQELREELLRGGSNSGEPVTYRLLRAVRMLHTYHVVPDPLAGRIWRLLARQPDLVFGGEVTDRAGRKGKAITFDFDLALPMRWVMIISPETGRLLAFEEILTTDAGKLNVRIPAVIGYTTFLSQRWVRNLN